MKTAYSHELKFKATKVRIGKYIW